MQNSVGGAPMSAPTTVLEALIQARERISTPERWCRGWYAKDADGYPILETEDEAASFCAVGAIGAVAPVGQDLCERAQGILHAEARRLGFLGVASFNDHRRTTHADVLALYDRAIARVTKEAL